MNEGKPPRVSVIVPAYNGVEYLSDAVESVLAQSYRSFEIVIVDDGSTDASPHLIESFGSAVRSFRQENGGTGRARNRGVEAARGELLAFLDQDDVWDHAKLDLQVAALDADPQLEAVFGMVRQFHSPELGDDFKSRVRCAEQPLAGYLPSAMLVRREAFERIGPFGEDWQLVEWTDWFVRAVERAMSMRLLPQIVAKRRLHQGNKGLALRSFQNEYPRILKALLDRRRKESQQLEPASDGKPGCPQE
jgi:glycosyltransferase involved in cell wall biosynthesis